MKSDNTRISEEISRLEEFLGKNRDKLDEKDRKSLELMLDLLTSIRRGIVDSKYNLGKLYIASSNIEFGKNSTKVTQYKIILQFDDIRILKIELSFCNDEKFFEAVKNYEDKAEKAKSEGKYTLAKGVEFLTNGEKERYEPGINVEIAWGKRDLGDKLHNCTNVSELAEKRKIEAEKLEKVIRSIFLNKGCTIKEHRAKWHVEINLEEFEFFPTNECEMKIISAIIETIKFLMNLTYLLN